MDGIIFKKCGKEDIEDIYNIEKLCFKNGMKKEILEKLLNDENSFVYAAIKDKTAAFLCYERVLEEGQIMSVAVHPKYRRQGIGKKLFEYVGYVAANDGIELFTLEVRRDNRPALALYRSVGFYEVGMRKNYYRDPVCDAILMDMRLGDEHSGE